MEINAVRPRQGEGSLRIDDSDDLQFPTAPFFGKYFKEHAGMTPMEYRKKHHKRSA